MTCIDEPSLVNLRGFDRAPDECRRLYSVSKRHGAAWWLK